MAHIHTGIHPNICLGAINYALSDKIFLSETAMSNSRIHTRKRVGKLIQFYNIPYVYLPDANFSGWL